MTRENREKEIRRVRRVLEILIAVIGIIIFIVIAGIVGNSELKYTRDGVITEIDNGIATIEDTTGNLWEVEAAKLSTGDSVEFQLSTCGTDTIYDDVVESVKLR